MNWGRFVLLIAVIALVIFLKNLDQKKPAKASISKASQKEVKGIANEIDKKVREGEKVAGDVLGTAGNFVVQQATKSAQIVTDLVVKNTVKGITDQVEKLPPQQQEEIRENLCK